MYKKILPSLQNIILNHQTVIIGLSGGPDSVALLHLLHTYRKQLNFRLIAAHLDHQWRINSPEEALFCQKLCNKLEIEFVTKEASKLTNLKTIKENGSKEALGRNLRRAFLQEMAILYQAQHIALAHHLDDQIETFFIRLTRGSALTGLGCMQIQNGLYIRPLLQINKQEILNYLDHHNLAFVIDDSNESDLFLRNRIRKLLPNVQELDTRFKPNLIRAINKIQDTNNFIQSLAKKHLIQITTNQNQLDLKLLKTLDPFLQNEVLLQWLYQNQVKFTQTEKFIHEIWRFLNSQRGSTHQINPDWAILKKNNLAQIIKQ